MTRAQGHATGPGERAFSGKVKRVGGMKVCLGAAKGRDVTEGAGAERGPDSLLQTQRERGESWEGDQASLPGAGHGHQE